MAGLAANSRQSFFPGCKRGVVGSRGSDVARETAHVVVSRQLPAEFAFNLLGARAKKDLVSLRVLVLREPEGVFILFNELAVLRQDAPMTTAGRARACTGQTRHGCWFPLQRRACR